MAYLKAEREDDRILLRDNGQQSKRDESDITFPTLKFV